jgi:hypothetical protein
MTTSRPVWRVNQSPRVVEQDTFASCLDWELQKASRLAYCVSVVSMVVDPMGQGPHGSLTALAEDMAARVRATDLVAVIPPRHLALLLVDAPTASLQTIMGRLSAETGLSETQTGWSAGASCYPATAQRTTDVLQQATDLMTRAEADGGNRLYLPSA